MKSISWTAYDHNNNNNNYYYNNKQTSITMVKRVRFRLVYPLQGLNDEIDHCKVNIWFMDLICLKLIAWTIFVYTIKSDIGESGKGRHSVGFARILSDLLDLARFGEVAVSHFGEAEGWVFASQETLTSLPGLPGIHFSCIKDTGSALVKLPSTFPFPFPWKTCKKSRLLSPFFEATLPVK